MFIDGRQVEFPAINKISFYGIYRSLEAMADSPDEAVARVAKSVLEDVNQYPILREGFEDKALVKEYWKPIEKLLRFVFPPALTTNEIKAVSAAFDFEPIHVSERFGKILAAAGDDYKLQASGFDDDKLYIIGCTVILQAYYHYPVSSTKPFIFEIPNLEQGTVRHYRVAYNADLMEVKPTERAIELTREDILELLDNFTDVDLWKKKFPPDSWIMRGIGIINMMDVSIDQSITQLTSNLLSQGKNTFEKVSDNLRMLFNIPDLRVAFVSKENDSFVQPPKEGMSSLMLGGEKVHKCDDMLCSHGYESLVENNEPLVLSSVPRYHGFVDNKLSNSLTRQGIGSYIATPVEHQGELLGYLELGSVREHELNSVSLQRLDNVLPIISMASARFREEMSNRIEAVIQAECTSIHESVKWKFVEAASKYLKEKQGGQDAVFSDLVFNEVYPLYGQVDIKGSSVTRNNAVRADLSAQMGLVKKILADALAVRPLPAYEELIYRLDNYLHELEQGLLAGSEHKILAFLRSEIYPIFDHLKKENSSLRRSIEEYTDVLHPTLNMIYRDRKDYDESVGMVNQTLAQFIDERQVEAQSMFPHYFERYKTDGVEYNMYVGQSLTKRRTYHPLYLQNIRLWQLITMCEMEREFSNLREKLPTPLEVASLILVYSSPLSIHFRVDEKRFDVEGAYNARYEIIKKRVDKAHITGTDERITQPGKIAIIYSSTEDAREYRKYLSFLGSKGLVKAETVEDHALENLQGITGLRALRVDVDYSSPTDNQYVDELIASLKE